MASMFVFINKIKSGSKVVSHLISIHWGHLQVPSSYLDYNSRDGNAALVLPRSCCDPPVCAWSKLGHCSLTIAVHIFFFTSMD